MSYLKKKTEEQGENSLNQDVTAKAADTGPDTSKKMLTALHALLEEIKQNNNLRYWSQTTAQEMLGETMQMATGDKESYLLHCYDLISHQILLAYQTMLEECLRLMKKHNLLT